MNDLLAKLGRKEQRGSKPRCHHLTHGPRQDVAARLTSLAAQFAVVSPNDYWMPDGFDDVREAQLHKAKLVEKAARDTLSSWWLAPESRRAKTPNFDIASTCTIEGAGKGLLLIEAKAHDEELNKEAGGRVIRKMDADPKRATIDEKRRQCSEDNRAASHGLIKQAIEEARAGLQQLTTLPCNISRDNCYQMSNRFAWAWKLTQLGTPVVLVYLGYLNTADMKEHGEPLADHGEWERLVRSHSAPLFSPDVWGRRWGEGRATFIPVIQSRTIDLASGRIAEEQS
jgi:hypothetical protein